MIRVDYRKYCGFVDSELVDSQDFEEVLDRYEQLIRETPGCEFGFRERDRISYRRFNPEIGRSEEIQIVVYEEDQIFPTSLDDLSLLE